MTSPFTDDATRKFFESHKYFGLESDQVSYRFLQTSNLTDSRYPLLLDSLNLIILHFNAGYILPAGHNTLCFQRW